MVSFELQPLADYVLKKIKQGERMLRSPAHSAKRKDEEAFLRTESALALAEERPSKRSGEAVLKKLFWRSLEGSPINLESAGLQVG